MTVNYHTHTSRCHHASGRDETYVKAAIKKGIKVLGFADHGPWPFENYVSGCRMTVEEAPGYFESVRKLKEKYKDEIDIRLGFEYEYYPQHIDWLKKFIKDNGIEYIILGQHDIPYEIGGLHTETATQPEQLLLYRDIIVEAIKSGLFLYVAHPDVYMYSYHTFDDTAREVAEDICRTAKEYDIPLECNVYGVRKNAVRKITGYPYPDFWKVAAKYGNRVVIGIDAHKPSHITCGKYLRQAEKLLSDCGITPEEIII